ncbi:uncharacterized protein PRCAT00002982001 [Priceomyces carsonii]|uniref:uncharacterized protein n=1 Tax=Priceomyces carsonii TaxID=28549 RepID=UPI002ED94185|nr:unnamed protein product [Priceomyces carsonii]
MANYIVCLAHFCELHGPSTIICTQVAPLEQESLLLLPSNSKLQTCASCKFILPDNSANLVTAERQEEGDRLFISSQYPTSQKRYSTLTKLVMKSLSVETTANLPAPVFYGDDANGYCISKVFKIKDVNARGAERKYSLMVICDSETCLLAAWDLIGTYLNEIVSIIQDQVILAVEDALRQKRSGSNGDGSVLDNEHYLRRSMVRPRSLAELTNDSQIFVKFHLWAMELLKDITRQA